MSDGSVMHSEWEPFTGEGHDVPDTFLWKTEDFTAFVRTWNAAAKKRGDCTRIRSVENEDAFEEEKEE